MTHGRDTDRAAMVRRTIANRGVHDQRVLDAMGAVEREQFVPAHEQSVAYEDHPLPIGEGQTISQPYIVALMAEAARIRPGDRVLEVGTGSGYGAAVLGRLADRVWSIERIGTLAARARDALADAGAGNVEVVVGDGSLGWPAAAPYDAIVVTAAAPEIPGALIDQLAEGGRLVIPVGRPSAPQRLACIERRGDELVETDLGGVAFVPLVGDG